MNAERWQQMERAFVLALPLSSEARASVLERECGADEELRRDVLSLLAAADRSGEFLSAPALESLAREMADDEPTFQAGERLGAYTLRELVGTGGAGEVWRATDARLDRDVAIKVLLPHLLHDRERVRRFEHEARTVGALNHPNILSVYDVGERDGAPFMVCEYLEGESLRARLRAGALPRESVVAIALQIARGLQAAHARGVVHRDLKPDNVFLREDGGVKLLDFGIATLETPTPHLPSDAPTAAPDGVVAGTAGYMAPEQARGQPVDARADLFALGATMYEMVTGDRPYRSGVTGDLLPLALTADPPSLARRPGVPPALAALIARLLARAPESRFQSATDVVRALEALTETPGGANRRRLLALAAAAGIGLLLAIAALLSPGWRRAAPGAGELGMGAGGRPAIAVMSFTDASGAPDTAWLSTGVPNMLMTGLAQTQGLDIVGARRLQEAAEQAGFRDIGAIDEGQMVAVARRAGAGAIVVGSVYSSGGEVRIDAQVEDISTGRVLAADRVRGADVFALVDELATRIRAGLGFAETSGMRATADVSTTSLAAYRLYSAGMEAAARLRWDAAAEKLEEAVALDPAFAEAHLRLAFVHRATGRIATYREDLNRAAAHADRLSERHRLLLDLELARAEGETTRQARLLDELLEKYPDAVEAYSHARRLYDPANGAFPDLEKLLAITRRGATVMPTAKEARLAHGYTLMDASRYAEALTEFEAYALLAPNEPNPHDSLGYLYLMLGRPERAVEEYSRSVAIDPAFGSRTGLAYALAVLGRYDEAIAADPADAEIRAIVLSRVGRYREADRVLAAAISEAASQANLVREAGLRLLKAWLALEWRDPAIAREQAQAALDRFVRTPGTWRIGANAAEVLLGVIEARSGSSNGARRRLERLEASRRPEVEADRLWFSVLAGEIAAADGDASATEAAHASATPSRPDLGLRVGGSVAFNNFGFRDGAARAAEARGDLAAAIAEYRRLLVYGPETRWAGLYEPRYLLALGRLLVRAGDAPAARAAYARFLELWKDADPELPELAEARRALRAF